MNKLEDVVVYVDPEGRPWRRVTNAQGFYENFEPIPLQALELERVRRNPYQGAWAAYGDEPLIYGGEPHGGYYRPRGRPTKRMTWYPQEHRDGVGNPYGQPPGTRKTWI